MTGVAGCGIIATRIVSCYGRYGMVFFTESANGRGMVLVLGGFTVTCCWSTAGESGRTS